MGEPYSPAPGVELIGPLGDNRGILVIGGRRWPVVEVASYWTSGGHAGGWMARIPFENGAVVLIVAHPDHVYDHGDVVGQTEPALFTASLHHQSVRRTDSRRRPPTRSRSRRWSTGCSTSTRTSIPGSFTTTRSRSG
jgi:hypothetical protein